MSGFFTENKYKAAIVNNRNGDNEFLALLRNLNRPQKQNHVLPADDSLSSLNVPDSQNRRPKGEKM
ncbi:hypothetical protein CHS0354_025307 [Potamilus streckersoni]|uniref:Uncharacterized protein n=1 Tax=Potamilus streckersoni TaxID=2493646 RepID=A0AAE0RUR2_9BIVA|nr:hypothetical protein CHS0354_025307 [Potamilus streckersoni]